MGNVFIGASTSSSGKYYWVIGKFPNLRVTTNKPRGKMVREPFETYRAAQIYIANEFSKNA